MRIAVNALSVVPGETGGGETYLVELLRAMEEHEAAQGCEIVVYCPENAAHLYRENGSVRRRVVELDNTGRLGRLAFEHLRLGPLVAADGADVLYAPGNALPLRLRTPAVLGVQSMHSFVVPEEMSRFRVAYFRRMVPRSARRAVRVLCVSEDIRSLLLREVPGLDERKVRVIYEGAPDDLGPIDDAGRVADTCAAQDRGAGEVRPLCLEPQSVQASRARRRGGGVVARAERRGVAAGPRGAGVRRAACTRPSRGGEQRSRRTGHPDGLASARGGLRAHVGRPA